MKLTGRFKLLLISGTAGTGKSTLLRKISTHVDTLTQVVDTDDFRSLVKVVNATINGEYPSDAFWFRSLDKERTIEELEQQCAQIQKFVIEPLVQSAINRLTHSCIMTGLMIPGRFDTTKFPEVDVTEVLLVLTDDDERKRRFAGRQEKRGNSPQQINDKFEKTIEMQEFFIKCAQDAGVPIIENNEHALETILKMFNTAGEECKK